MIIECKNCNKKFKVNDELIPTNGRQIKCGSCKHIWHFKIENPLEKTPVITNKNITSDKTENRNIEKNSEILSKININVTKGKNETQKNDLNVENNVKNQSSNNLFSYLLVFIISFVGLIIFVDTVKTPLITLFPGLEIILFNLFETLKDVKLFIIDLT
jgi:predicted Zn finger-like uncharacterized protein